ncbi:MAG TPA: type I DNA topoisomerase, partial [Dehalococcoidia bacterium]|nr:type I DNA topoisomerase [Dehalococcoidia bacterium]
MAKSKELVVVESPAKARTISSILGRDYEVKASIGHVRDLPKANLGVDPEHGFQPRYIIPKAKRKAVKEIEDAARNASIVYLATDPDREGEAIAWHLVEAINLDGIPYKRIVFHEITPEAIRKAFEEPRDIDTPLVDAQQARRILDRLVGYRLSPFLWKKVKSGLSAGRVQSVALRLLVEREREIENFDAQEYWTIDVLVEKTGTPPSFKARLAGYVDKKRDCDISSETQATALVDFIEGARLRVSDVKQREQVRRPSPPFITSTLQQEASRRLGYSAKRTMAIAQQLYEGVSMGAQGQAGLITYMRTDSLEVGQGAKEEARRYIGQRFGQAFVPKSPRFYRKKVRGAQEAHEAIRPTSMSREPDSVRSFLSNEQYRLYTLIWQRMIASQMADAVYDVATAEIEATQDRPEDTLLLRATNTQLRFPGYRQLYVEGRDDDTEEDEGSNPLPELATGDALRILEGFPEQHFTQPPPHFTEATLVKALEEKGIGRPSTYAPILSTIQDRGYVQKQGRQLLPTDLGVVVNDLLVENFPNFVDIDFTAAMEDELDDIANGERAWQPVVQQIYQPLEAALEAASDVPPAREETDEVCDLCGRPMVIRWGRHGRFLSCSGFPECKNSKPLAGEEQPSVEASEETCDECGAPMVVKRGRFGPFLACSRYPECKGSKPIQVKVGVA